MIPGQGKPVPFPALPALDAISADPDDLAHPNGPRLEFRKTEQATEQTGQPGLLIVSQGKIEDTVSGVAHAWIEVWTRPGNS